MVEEIRNTHLCPRNDTALDYHLWLGTKILRLPQHKIRKGTNSNLADLVGHAVADSSKGEGTGQSIFGRICPSHSRVDGVLGDVSFDPVVVVAFNVSAERSAHIPHLGCCPPSSCHHLSYTAHRLRVAADHRDSAGVMEDVLSSNSLSSNPRISKGNVFGDRLVEVVTDLTMELC